MIIVGSALAARSETAMEFLAEYDVVITLAITLIFVVGFFIRWRYKE